MTLRILVTGFSAFPGAPVNPTETLLHMLADRPPDLPPGARMRCLLLPVEYAAVPAMLAAEADFAPDVAVHFGLAARARGFRLERRAANRCAMRTPDAAGSLPPGTSIADGPKTIASTLPLASIAAALEAAGLPVEWSGSAGSYLCNYTFYLARAGVVAGYAPPVAGFVHVPYLASQMGALAPAARAGLSTLTEAQLLEGARLVVAGAAAHASNLNARRNRALSLAGR